MDPVQMKLFLLMTLVSLLFAAQLMATAPAAAKRAASFTSSAF